MLVCWFFFLSLLFSPLLCSTRIHSPGTSQHSQQTNIQPKLAAPQCICVLVASQQAANKAANPPPPTIPMPTHPPATWLPPIPGLHRRDPEHRYWLGEVEFPVSVTGVLGCLKSDYAMERIEATRATWEPRGNSCHRALELFLSLADPGEDDLTGAVDPVTLSELGELTRGDHADWIQPLIRHERWHSLRIIASERPTCCLARKVAGTFDLAFIDESGRRILADLKSLGPNGATYSTAAQLGGYMACEATWGHHYDAGQTIWCRPGQTTFSPLYSVAECRLAWAAAWATWRARPPAPF